MTMGADSNNMEDKNKEFKNMKIIFWLKKIVFFFLSFYFDLIFMFLQVYGIFISKFIMRIKQMMVKNQFFSSKMEICVWKKSQEKRRNGQKF